MAARPITITLVGDDQTGKAFKSAEGNAQSFGGTIEKVSGIGGKAFGALGIGAGIAAGAMATFSKSMDISAASDKLAAQLGLTAEESQKYGKIAGNLYASAYGDSMEEVNTAIGSVRSSIQGMASASAEDLQAASATAIDLAKIFDLDVSEAAASAGNIIRTGLADTATEAFDLMTVALQKVPAAMRGDLLEATNEYGVYLHDLGLSGEEAFGLLASAAQGGTIQLDKAGDALKEFSIRSTDMSKTSVDAYQKLGLNAQDMSNKILAGGDVAKGAFDTIVAGLLGIKDPTDQANTAIALFGTPLEDIGVNKIPEFIASLQNAGGSLGEVQGASKRAGDEFNDNAQTKLTAFKRSLETNVVNFLGGSVIPKLEETKKSLEEHGLAWDAVKVVSVAALVAMSAAMLIHGAIIVGGWVAMGTQATIQAARMAAAWIVAMGPVAWVIAAIVGLAIVIYKNWDTIKAKTTEAWNAVSSTVSTKITEAVNWVKGLPGRVMGALGDMDNLLRGSGGRLIQGLINGITDKIGALKNKVREAAQAVKDFWPFSPAKTGPLSGRGDLRYSGRSMVDQITGGINDKVPALKGAANNAAATVSNALTSRSLVTAEFSATGRGGLYSGTSVAAATASGGGSSRPVNYSPTLNFTINGADPKSVKEQILDALDRHDIELVRRLQMGVRP